MHQLIKQMVDVDVDSKDDMRRVLKSLRSFHDMVCLVLMAEELSSLSVYEQSVSRDTLKQRQEKKANLTLDELKLYDQAVDKIRALEKKVVDVSAPKLYLEMGYKLSPEDLQKVAETLELLADTAAEEQGPDEERAKFASAVFIPACHLLPMNMDFKKVKDSETKPEELLIVQSSVNMLIADVEADKEFAQAILAQVEELENRKADIEKETIDLLKITMEKEMERFKNIIEAEVLKKPAIFKNQMQPKVIHRTSEGHIIGGSLEQTVSLEKLAKAVLNPPLEDKDKLAHRYAGKNNKFKHAVLKYQMYQNMHTRLSQEGSSRDKLEECAVLFGQYEKVLNNHRDGFGKTKRYVASLFLKIGMMVTFGQVKKKLKEYHTKLWTPPSRETVKKVRAFFEGTQPQKRKEEEVAPTIVSKRFRIN